MSVHVTRTELVKLCIIWGIEEILYFFHLQLVNTTFKKTYSFVPTRFCFGEVNAEMKTFLNDASPIEAIEEAGVRLFRFIYHAGTQTLSRTRFSAFSKQAASGKLNHQNLPPTEGAAKLHPLRAYLQMWDWLKLEPMHLDPLKYGWRMKNKDGYEPIPTLEPIAPKELLELTHCNCLTSCSSRRCSCKKNDMRCISACGYCKGTACNNAMAGDPC